MFRSDKLVQSCGDDRAAFDVSSSVRVVHSGDQAAVPIQQAPVAGFSVSVSLSHLIILKAIFVSFAQCAESGDLDRSPMASRC